MNQKVKKKLDFLHVQVKINTYTADAEIEKKLNIEWVNAGVVSYFVIGCSSLSHSGTSQNSHDLFGSSVLTKHQGRDLGIILFLFFGLLQ